MNYDELIRAKRKEMKLTQGQQIDLVGVSQQIVAKYENGNAIPRPNTWRDICRVLGIDFEEMKKPSLTKTTANDDAELHKLYAELAREMFIVKHELRKVSDELEAKPYLM